MKLLWTVVAIALLVAVAGWATYQATMPAAPNLATFMPQGALLFVDAKDFGALLNEWNNSKQKQAWLKSDTLSVFSRSRLYYRLESAQKEFEAVAGVAPGMNLLGQSAGDQTALALYDIGQLELLYISHTTAAKAMQNALFQARAKFETRQVDGKEFYVRKDADTERTVAFASVGDYLVIGTREDLVAAAVGLMSGNLDRQLAEEQWYATALKQAGEHGDLRMVLNLEKIVPTPHFRTYWVQQNITDMKQYSAAVADLFRGQTYREERVLLRGDSDGEKANADEQSARSVAVLAQATPAAASFYSVSRTNADAALDAMVTKILAPHIGVAPPDKIAPRVTLGSGQTGSESDLETRIDVAPQSATEQNGAPTDALKQLLGASDAMMIAHHTERAQNGVFVAVRSAVVLHGASDWNRAAVLTAIQQALKPGLTTAALGVTWQERQENGTRFDELDGLMPVVVAVEGRTLVVSNDRRDVVSVLQKLKTAKAPEALSYVAEFNHAAEAANFKLLTGYVDQTARVVNTGTEHQPAFFSENIASLSDVFAAVKSEKIVHRDHGATVQQTVTYEWAQ